MLESIVRAMVAARKITLSHRAAFPRGTSQPAVYLNFPTAFKEPEKNLLHHFKAAHGHEIELFSFPHAKIAEGLYDKTRSNGAGDNDIKIYSYVENWSGTDSASLVFVNDGLNYCHKRFYALKELIHLVTVTENNVTVSAADIDVLIDSLVNASPLAEGDGESDIDSEGAAYFGALELLLNKESVNNFLVQNAGIDNESAAELLARTYSLPKKWVSVRLRHHAFFNNSIYDRPEFAQLA